MKDSLLCAARRIIVFALPAGGVRRRIVLSAPQYTDHPVPEPDRHEIAFHLLRTDEDVVILLRSGIGKGGGIARTRFGMKCGIAALVAECGVGGIVQNNLLLFVMQTKRNAYVVQQPGFQFTDSIVQKMTEPVVLTGIVGLPTDRTGGSGRNLKRNGY